MLKELGTGTDGKEISEDDMLSELRQRVESELRLDYLVTGSKVPLVDPISCASTNSKVQMVVEGEPRSCPTTWARACQNR